MNPLPQALRTVTVIDTRSFFTTVGVAWRLPPHAAEHSPGRSLRWALQHGELSEPAVHPVHCVWATSEDMESVVVSLPEEKVLSWLRYVHYIWFASLKSVEQPVIAVAGSERIVEQVNQAMGSPSPTPQPPASIPCAMRQTQDQGITYTTLHGPDPSHRAGHAATHVALCTLLAGPEGSLQNVVQRNGTQAQVGLRRTFEAASPTLQWTIISSSERSIETLQTVASLAEELAHSTAAAPSEAIARAKANVVRSWNAPVSLVQAMAQYEVMGWGSQLITDPDQAFEGVEDQLRDAFQGLLMPLANVLDEPVLV